MFANTRLRMVHVYWYNQGACCLCIRLRGPACVDGVGCLYDFNPKRIQVRLSEHLNKCTQVLESFREKLKRFLEEVKDRKKDRKKQAARIAAQIMQTPRTPTVRPCVHRHACMSRAV
jgi:hypothetical protein